MHPNEMLGIATGWAETVLGKVTPDRYADPTPCSEWTVRDLAGHLVGGTAMFAAAVHGDPLGPPEADPIGDDAQAAYRSAAASLRAAFDAPDAMGRMVELPVGTMPGQVAHGLALLDAVVHTWDLAVATGQDSTAPAGVAEAADAVARELVSEQWRGPGRPFAAEVEAGPDASPTERLVAFLGRRR